MRKGSLLMGGQIKWKMREEKRRGRGTQRPRLGHSPLVWVGGNATAHFMLCLCFWDGQSAITPAVLRLLQPPQRVACQQPQPGPRVRRLTCFQSVPPNKEFGRIIGRREGRKTGPPPEQTEQSTMSNLCYTMTALPFVSWTFHRNTRQRQ